MKLDIKIVCIIAITITLIWVILVTISQSSDFTNQFLKLLEIKTNFQ